MTPTSALPPAGELWPLRAVYFCLFFAGAAFFGYIALYLKRLGMSGSEIGLLLSIGPLVGLLAQPLWGVLSDGAWGPVRVFRLTLAYGVVLGLVFPYTTAYLALVCLMMAKALFSAPHNPLSDAITLRALGERANAYGRIRMYGSIGFSLAVLLVGKIVERTSLHHIFYWHAAALAGVLIATGFLRVPAPSPAENGRRQGPLRLLADGGFRNFLLFIFLVQTTLAGGNAFLGIVIDQLGGREGDIGLAHMISAAVCFPLYWFSERWLNRYGTRRLLFAGAVVYALRWWLMSLAVSPGQILGIQALHGPAWVLTFTAAIAHVHRLTPAGAKTTGQAVFSAVFFGLSQMAGSLAAGYLLDAAGAPGLYRILGSAALVAAASFIPLVGFAGERMRLSTEEPEATRRSKPLARGV